MQRLKRIHVAGWKSIKDQTIDLRPLTVVIGANGAGKSNLLSLFKLLNVLFAGTPGLRNFVAVNNYAHSLLHYGARNPHGGARARLRRRCGTEPVPRPLGGGLRGVR